MFAKTRQKRKRRIFLTAVIYLLLFLAALSYMVGVYKYAQFGDAQPDEIIFYMTNGLESAGSSSSFTNAIRDNVLLLGILYFFLLLPAVDFYRNRIIIQVSLAAFGSKRRLRFNPSHVSLRLKFIYALVVFLIGFWFLLSSFHVIQYVRALGQSSQIFEQHYVDPATVKLQFPKHKRNLIYIYMESMENTVASTKNGGQADKSRIPELEQLALDPANVSFSNKPTGLGGALPATGTTWTVAGITAQSTGLPLRDSLFGAGQNDQGEFKYFLPGAFGIGQALQKHGYNQEFIMGSEADFGGRDKLLTQHGGYKLLDLDYYKKIGRLPPDYHIWWGFEDRKLFQYAREEATKLSSEGKPFNLSLLTADTHFTDGYMDPRCPQPFPDQYDNVHACSSAQIVDFIHWIQQQPFAKDTTIVMSGDHLGMQTSYYDAMIHQDGYQRTVYNAFVNSAVQPEKSHSRLFTTFDMYPSTLAAMGVKIPGNHLGLGINLFSSQPTLLETYGSLDALNAELSKRSDYYNQKILSGL